MSVYPPPQQPPKSGFPKGLVIAVVALLLLGGAIVVVLALGIGGYLYYSAATAEPGYGAAPSSGAGSGSAAAPADEVPSPTAAQTAALAGGQTATWSGQGLSWTVPAKWSKASEDKTTLLWRSPGSWDAASLIASISPMSADFPADASLNAYYDQATQRLARGEVTEVKWLVLDGVRGVMWREGRPSSEDDPQRLQWLGYRSYLGETQLVNIMLASRAKDAAKHEDVMYGVLYSTKIPH